MAEKNEEKGGWEKPQSSISKKFDEKQIDVNLVEWFIGQIFSFCYRLLSPSSRSTGRPPVIITLRLNIWVLLSTSLSICVNRKDSPIGEGLNMQAVAGWSKKLNNNNFRMDKTIFAKAKEIDFLIVSPSKWKFGEIIS